MAKSDIPGFLIFLQPFPGEIAQADRHAVGWLSLFRGCGLQELTWGTWFYQLGFCEIPEHFSGYLNSPHCHDAEVILGKSARQQKIAIKKTIK